MSQPSPSPEDLDALRSAVADLSRLLPAAQAVNASESAAEERRVRGIPLVDMESRVNRHHAYAPAEPVATDPYADPYVAASVALQGAYEHGLALAGRPVRSQAERIADAAEIRQASEARSAAVRQHADELAAAYGTAQQLRSFR